MEQYELLICLIVSQTYKKKREHFNRQTL